MSTIALREVRYCYPGASSDAVIDVSVELAAGELRAVLGPNGSGKSTLLRLALGALIPAAGAVSYAGRPLQTWDRRELARRLGAVPQYEELSFPLTVRQLVAMGRYPHLGPWRREREVDRLAIQRALERCDVAPLAHRPLATLSGGERQRVRIARALAQEPETLVLDEPSVSLDIRHEMAIFELLRRLARDERTAILLVTHHLNIAARYADRLVLLAGGRIVADGSPAEVLRREILEPVYAWPVAVLAHPGPGPDTGAPQITPLALESTPNPTGP
ncbi:MAG: ABC transporter ATP-binding protein [Longimicrobiales bacterium]